MLDKIVNKGTEIIAPVSCKNKIKANNITFVTPGDSLYTEGIKIAAYVVSMVFF